MLEHPGSRRHRSRRPARCAGPPHRPPLRRRPPTTGPRRSTSPSPATSWMATGACSSRAGPRTKPTWPGTWTNGCCGHPQMGETLREAVVRRVSRGARAPGRASRGGAARLRLPGGDARRHGRARAVPGRGRARSRARRCPTPTRWTTWRGSPGTTSASARPTDPASLSPWSVEQIALLDALDRDPRAWLAEPGGRARRPAPRRARRCAARRPTRGRSSAATTALWRWCTVPSASCSTSSCGPRPPR